jgi:hypothetical protein
MSNVSRIDSALERLQLDPPAPTPPPDSYKRSKNSISALNGMSLKDFLNAKQIYISTDGLYTIGEIEPETPEKAYDIDVDFTVQFESAYDDDDAKTGHKVVMGHAGDTYGLTDNLYSERAYSTYGVMDRNGNSINVPFYFLTDNPDMEFSAAPDSQSIAINCCPNLSAMTIVSSHKVYARYHDNDTKSYTKGYHCRNAFIEGFFQVVNSGRKFEFSEIFKNHVLTWDKNIGNILDEQILDDGFCHIKEPCADVEWRKRINNEAFQEDLIIQELEGLAYIGDGLKGKFKKCFPEVPEDRQNIETLVIPFHSSNDKDNLTELDKANFYILSLTTRSTGFKIVKDNRESYLIPFCLSFREDINQDSSVFHQVGHWWNGMNKALGENFIQCVGKLQSRISSSFKFDTALTLNDFSFSSGTYIRSPPLSLYQKVPETTRRLVFSDFIPQSITAAVAVNGVPTISSIQPADLRLDAGEILHFQLVSPNNRQTIFTVIYDPSYKTFYFVPREDIPLYSVFNTHEAQYYKISNAYTSTPGNLPTASLGTNFLSRIVDPVDANRMLFTNKKDSPFVTTIPASLARGNKLLR